MSDSIPADVLQALQSDDERNGAMRAHALLNDADAKLMVVILSSIGLPWSTPKKKQPPLDDVAALWDWAWKGAKFSDEWFRDQAGYMNASEEAVFKRVRATRMVFPDGTPSRWAKAIVEAEVSEMVGKIKRKKK